MKQIAIILLLPMIGCSTIMEPADDICSKVMEFAEAPIQEGKSRRSITLFWHGDWMDFENGFGKACRYSKDDALSKSLCAWLPNNTSTEFPQSVPMRILKCYGYKFPSHSSWSDWQSSIDLWGASEKPLLLEVDLKYLPNHDRSIRLTMFAEGHGDYDEDFTPLFKRNK